MLVTVAILDFLLKIEVVLKYRFPVKAEGLPIISDAYATIVMLKKGIQDTWSLGLPS